MYLSEYTGKGIRIAVIDSGVHAGHPHVGGVAGGVAIRDDGTLDDDFVDRLGHGTAVAAAIREKAPGSDLLAVKVFWRTLATSVTELVPAIDEESARGRPGSSSSRRWKVRTDAGCPAISTRSFPCTWTGRAYETATASCPRT